MSATQAASTPVVSKPKKPLWRRIFRAVFYTGLASLGVFLVLNLTGLVTVGDAVELFRKVTGEPGTRFVRWAEEIYFEAAYDVKVWWSGNEDAPADGATVAAPLVVGGAAAVSVVKDPVDLVKSEPIDAPPPRRPPASDIPWTPYVHPDGTASGIYTAQIFPNNTLPEEPVYLAWIDHEMVQPRWVPGVTEPEGDPAGKLDRSGKVPARDQEKLVAAFNGGYLSKHGNFGAKFDGTTVIPLREGLATGAIKRDGTFLLGAYGRDIDPKDKDVITARQNLRLIVDGGQVPKDIQRRAHGAIRPTISENDPLAGDLKAHTWRSGLGITKDGDLLFAAGDFLDGAMLADSLQWAGAERAMQLDVNAPYFCVFVFFEPDGQGNLSPLVLGPKMTPRPGQFISSRSNKDFVYLTRKF